MGFTKKIPALLLSCIYSIISMGQVPLLPRDSTIKGPQTFALIVGISKYKYVQPLRYADKDAELFRDYLKSPAGGSVKDENIFCLLNEKANNSNFWGKGFQWLKAKELERGDKLFIYLAGHGDAIDEDQFFFLGYDCNPAGDKNNYLVSGAIQLFNLKKKIAAETVKGVEVVFIMDACRSNELPGGLEGQNFLNTAVSEKKVGDIIMLATGAGQESLEDATIGNGHGLFTYYLVDGLSGLADSKSDPDNKISFREIESYVDLHVPEVALQQFKRKQDPYFCCNEKNNQVISIVDSSYLQNWLKQKKLSEKGPGNSINALMKKNKAPIDTALLALYNRFYKAIQLNNTRGRDDAMLLYDQLEKKYSGNPYTLDARSTLAVSYLDFAQNKINDYLGCATSSVQDQREAGERLEKAIDLFKKDDPDFANSLMNRLYLLKASAENSITAFHNAYSALAIDPKAAYISNKLALMHLQKGNKDSALYYARKATEIAPKWNCAATTLSMVNNFTSTDTSRTSKKNSSPSSFGVTIGAGISIPHINFSRENWRQGNINYNDSLNDITTSSGARVDLGIFLFLNLGRSVSFRPALDLVYENGKVIYNRKSPVGGTGFADERKADRASANIELPLVFRFTGKNIVPYLSAGPAFCLAVPLSGQSQILKKTFDLQGEAGLGIEFRSKSLIIAPEARYVHGFSNVKGSANNIYQNTITALKKNAFVFSIYFRRK
jgi:tetratricopeptide (TPR) repeat protein